MKIKEAMHDSCQKGMTKWFKNFHAVNLRKDLKGAVAIAAVGMILGLTVDAFRKVPLLSRRGSPGATTTSASAHLQLHRGAIFLDARPSAEYAQEHVSGALSLPWNEYAEKAPNLLPYLRKATMVVIYGADSERMALALANSGVTAVQAMSDGLQGWKEAGYPLSARNP